MHDDVLLIVVIGVGHRREVIARHFSSYDCIHSLAGDGKQKGLKDRIVSLTDKFLREGESKWA